MKINSKMLIAILGIAMAMASCSQEAAELIKPKYNLTFTGLDMPVLDIQTTSSASGLQSYDATIPEDVQVLYHAIWSSDPKRNEYEKYWYPINEIPDSVKVPALEADNYYAYFSTWGNAITNHAHSFPLYYWNEIIDLNDNIDREINLKLGSGRVKVTMKEGQELSEDYNRFEVVYELDTFRSVSLHENNTYTWGTNYEYDYEGWFSMYPSTNEGTVGPYSYAPNNLMITSIKLYDAQGVIVKTVEINQEITVEIGHEINLIVDVDALCNVCEPCLADPNYFILAWEQVDYTQEEILLN